MVLHTFRIQYLTSLWQPRSLTMWCHHKTTAYPIDLLKRSSRSLRYSLSEQSRVDRILSWSLLASCSMSFDSKLQSPAEMLHKRPLHTMLPQYVCPMNLVMTETWWWLKKHAVNAKCKHNVQGVTLNAPLCAGKMISLWSGFKVIWIPKPILVKYKHGSYLILIVAGHVCWHIHDHFWEHCINGSDMMQTILTPLMVWDMISALLPYSGVSSAAMQLPHSYFMNANTSDAHDITCIDS